MSDGGAPTLSRVSNVQQVDRRGRIKPVEFHAIDPAVGQDPGAHRHRSRRSASGLAALAELIVKPPCGVIIGRKPPLKSALQLPGERLPGRRSFCRGPVVALLRSGCPGHGTNTTQQPADGAEPAHQRAQCPPRPALGVRLSTVIVASAPADRRMTRTVCLIPGVTEWWQVLTASTACSRTGSSAVAALLRNAGRRTVGGAQLPQFLAQIGNQLLDQPIPDFDLRAQIVRCDTTCDRHIEAEHQEGLAELQPAEPSRHVPAIDEIERQITLHLQSGNERDVGKPWSSPTNWLPGRISKPSPAVAERR